MRIPHSSALKYNEYIKQMESVETLMCSRIKRNGDGFFLVKVEYRIKCIKCICNHIVYIRNGLHTQDFEEM